MFARMLIPRASAMQRSHDGSRREQQELNRTESSARSSNLSWGVSVRTDFAQQDGERDPAGEPEDHGDGLDAENGEFVGGAGELHGCDGEICYG